MRLIAIGISPLCGGPSGPPRAAMLLSGSGIFAENIAGGAALGTLSVINATGTPAYTLTDSDGSRVALTGANVTRGATAWDYETHEFVTFTVSVSGVTPAIAPRTFLMIATNVLEVTLAALGLSPSTIVEGSTAGTVVGAITGKTGGSTLTLTDDAGGRFAILGTNLVTGSTPTDYETSTLHAVTIRETHPDAAPRDTALAVTVTNVFEAGEPGPFTLTWTSAASELTNLAFSLSPAPLVGDSVTLYLDNDAGVTSPFATSAANVIDSSEAASGSLTFTGITTPLSPGLTYAKVTVVRGIYTVDSSIASKTLTGSSYVTQAVSFDGTDYMTGTANTPLAGSVNSQKGMVSFWVRMRGNDGGYHLLFENANESGLQMLRGPDNKWDISAKNAAGINAAAHGKTSALFTTAQGWQHVLVSWDVDVVRYDLYVNDVSSKDGSSGVDGSYTISYTSPQTITIGARGAGSLPCILDIEDLWIHYGTGPDLSVAATRRGFISAAGKPVDLGATGVVGGLTPIAYFSGRSGVASWHVNKGSGGNMFTLTGTLAAAPTQPST